MKSYVIATPAQLGQILKSARLTSELSQIALGQQVNVLQKTVSALENNPAGSQIETVFKILSALNLELVLRHKPDDEDTQDEW
jgi:HTH-type transcriptional regulator/antitoxin HipB